MFLRSKYTTTETWVNADGDEFTRKQDYCVAGNTKFYGTARFRLWPADFGVIVHHGGISPCVAVGLRRPSAVVRRRRGPVRGAWSRG